MIGINVDKKRYKYGCKVGEEVELVSIREICDYQRSNLANAAATMAEVMNMWEKTYPHKFINEKLKEVKEKMVDDIEWHKISKSGLSQLGFNTYMKEDVFNIPIELFPLIQEGTVLRCVDGKDYIVGQDNIELFETRYGCIPYGFIR